MDLPIPRPLELYPAQAEGVRRFLRAQGGRLLLCYGTGCGKTPTTIRSIVEHSRLNPAFKAGGSQPRILVACPAMVRRHWATEFLRWGHMQAFPIEMGRNTQGGTKAQRALRDVAYEARIQICSYDLLPQVDHQGWNYIVFDEIHHLGDPGSRQSRRAWSLLSQNKHAALLGLSATLLPTDLKQIWNPLRLFWGEREWGNASRTGGISWKFAERYCGITRNDYGAAIGKGLPEALPALRERIQEVAHQVQRQDICKDMPPLTVRVLTQAGEGLSIPGKRTEPLEKSAAYTAAMQWRKDLPDDITHAVILVYHRDKAVQLAASMRQNYPEFSTYHVDGTQTPAGRGEILDACEADPKAVLIATTESLKEGIRLMWAQQVLLAEWRQSPAQVLQVLGRFQSVGDDRKPIVDILVDDNMHAEAERLIERVEVMNSVLQTGALAKEIPELFKPQELSGASMQSQIMDLFSGQEVAALRASFDGEVEEADDD